MRAETVQRDAPHRVHVRERDVVEHAPAQERFGEVALRVARDHHDRPVPVVGPQHGVAALGNAEVQVFQLVQHVVREVARRLVDLVDQHDRPPRLVHVGVPASEPDPVLRRQCREDRGSERVPGDVPRRIAGVAPGRSLEAPEGVVAVEQRLRRRVGLRLELEQRVQVQAPRQVARELGLPAAGLPGQEQRLPQDQGDVHGSRRDPRRGCTPPDRPRWRMRAPGAVAHRPPAVRRCRARVSGRLLPERPAVQQMCQLRREHLHRHPAFLRSGARAPGTSA